VISNCLFIPNIFLFDRINNKLRIILKLLQLNSKFELISKSGVFVEEA